MTVQFGRLPPIPDKRRLIIAAPTWAVPAPDPVVDHLSGVPTQIYGNDDWGDCVVAACANDLEASWRALCPTEPPPLVTAQDCIDAYKKTSGATSPPGPGLVTAKFLDWLIRNPLHPGDPRTQALAWGTPARDGWTIRAVNSEFVGGIYGVAIHTAQEYPSSSWGCSGGSLLGYHEVCGGRHDTSSVFCLTWAYQATMSSCYVSNYLDEHHIIIWPHVWEALSPERKASLAADYQALTGRPFPSIPDPTPSPSPRTAMSYTTIPDGARILDSRSTGNVGFTGKLATRTPRQLQITGPIDYIDANGTKQHGELVPVGAVAVSANITVTGQSSSGYIAVTTSPRPYPRTSWLNFPTGDDRANGGIFPLAEDGSLSVVFVGRAGATCDLVVDLGGYFTA
jgi:hypothetical protein